MYELKRLFMWLICVHVENVLDLRGNHICDVGDLGL